MREKQKPSNCIYTPKTLKTHTFSIPFNSIIDLLRPPNKPPRESPRGSPKGPLNKGPQEGFCCWA